MPSGRQATHTYEPIQHSNPLATDTDALAVPLENARRQSVAAYVDATRRWGMDEHRFAIGQSVLWRSRPSGAIGFVLAANVVRDDSVIALYQPAEAPTRRRLGPRGGPSGRNLLVDEWDGRHKVAKFSGPPVVRAYVPGASYSVIRRWNPHLRDFTGWYVNLERPWTRTALGFDSEDYLLDVVFTNDRSAWTLKDEDELDWAVETGTISEELSGAIRHAGERAVSDSASDSGVFGIDWSTIAPSHGWDQPSIPTNWDTAI